MTCGVTYVRYSSSCFWWFDEQNIIEADIAIYGSSTFEWGNPLCNTYSLPGSRTTISHEMGHAFGLEHYDSAMNLMMTSNGEGKYCGNFVIEPHPDNAQGSRFLYLGMADLLGLYRPFTEEGDTSVTLVTNQYAV